MNRKKLLAVVLLALFSLGGMLTGEERKSTDLWGLWRTGFEKYEAAEKAAKRSGGEKDALRLYNEAYRIFMQIKQESPSWNKEVIAYRINLCTRRIAGIQHPREEALRRATAEKQAEVARLREEVRKLQEQLAKCRSELIETGRTAKRAVSAETESRRLMSENQELNRKLAAANLLLDDVREKLRRADRTAEFQGKLQEERSRSQRLEQQLKSMTLENEKLRLKVRDVTEERMESDLRVRNATATIQKLEAELQRRRGVESELAALQAEQKRLKEEYASLQEKLARTEQSCVRLSEQVEEYRSGRIVPPSVRKLEDDLRAERNRAEYTRTLVEKAARENATLKQQLETLQAEKKKLVLDLVRCTELVNQQKKTLDSLAGLTGKNADLEKRLAELTAENEKLRKDLAGVAAKYEEQRKTVLDCGKLTAQLEDAGRKIESMKLRVAESDKKIADLQNMLNAASSAAKTADELRNGLVRENAALRKTNTEAAAEISRCRTELRQAQATVQTLTREKEATVAQLKQQLAEAERHLAEIRADEQKKLQTLAEKTAALEQQLADAKREAAASSGKSSGQMDLLNRKIASLEQELAASRKQTQDAMASDRIRKLQEQNAALAAKLADAERRAAAGAAGTASSQADKARIRELEATVDDLTKKLAAKPQTVTTVVESQADKARIRELEATVDDLTKKLAAKPQTVTTVVESQADKARIRELEATVDDLTKKLAAKPQTVTTVVESQADKARIRELEDRLTLLTRKQETAERDLAGLRRQAAEKDQIITDLRTVSATSEKTVTSTLRSLRSELERSQADNKKLTDQAAKLLAENRDLSQKLADTVRLEEHRRISAELAEKKAELKRLQDTVQLEREKALNEKRLADDQIRELKRRIEEYNQASDKSAKSEIARLTATITELTEGKSQYENTIRRLTADRNRLSGEIRDLKLQLASVQTELTVAKDKLASPREDADSVRMARELEKQVRELESRLKTAQTDLANKNALIRSLEEKLKTSGRETMEAQIVADRYRKELLTWSGNPEGSEQQLKRKDEAIDDLIREGTELRKELAMLKSELAMAKDEVRRARDLSVKAARNFYRLRLENSRLRARISAASGGSAVFAKMPEVPEEVLQHMERMTETSLGKTSGTEASAQFKEAMQAAQNAEKEKDFGTALLNYWRAVDADPTNYEAQLGVARAYLERGEKASAAKAYAKAIELGAPKDPALEARLK